MADLDPWAVAPPNSSSCNDRKGAPLQRRAHHKSRTGCRPCKASRIKCDENHPFCKNCVRRDALCEYFDTKLRPRDRPRVEIEILPSHCPSSSTGELISPTSLSNGRFSIPLEGLSSHSLFARRELTPTGRHLERQLLYHYIEMSKQATDVQSAWAFWALEQAAQSQCVMDALLGISAFHLRGFDESNKALQEASHKYMACAIRDHRRELSSGLNKDNVSSVAATCALVSVHSNVNRYYLADEDSHQMPHHWFLSFRRGIRLFHLASPLIQNSMVRQEFLDLDPTNQIIEQGTHNNPFSFLLYFTPSSASPNQQDISVCMPVVAHLSYIHADLTNRKPLRFPAVVSSPFVDLVAAKNPRALAISGYYFMLVKEGRQFWWVDGAPEREFAVIMSLLPRDWWPVMDWAIRAFEWTES